MTGMSDNPNKKYIDYIKRSGGNPKIEWFDEDWEPIGPTLREDMKSKGLIKEVDGKIYLVESVN